MVLQEQTHGKMGSILKSLLLLALSQSWPPKLTDYVPWSTKYVPYCISIFSFNFIIADREWKPKTRERTRGESASHRRSQWKSRRIVEATWHSELSLVCCWPLSSFLLLGVRKMEGSASRRHWSLDCSNSRIFETGSSFITTIQRCKQPHLCKPNVWYGHLIFSVSLSSNWNCGHQDLNLQVMFCPSLSIFYGGLWRTLFSMLQNFSQSLLRFRVLTFIRELIQRYIRSNRHVLTGISQINAILLFKLFL